MGLLSMATEAQIKANQANAKRSTGPKSIAGKEVSSRNAISHGLTAKISLLPGEDVGEFEAMKAQLVAEFGPASGLEEQLVGKLASDLWRLRRIPVFEAAIFEYTEYLESVEPLDDLVDGGILNMAAATGDEKSFERRSFGRLLSKVLSGSDMLSKLDRHESHLARQIRFSLDRLQYLRSKRAEM